MHCNHLGGADVVVTLGARSAFLARPTVISIGVHADDGKMANAMSMSHVPRGSAASSMGSRIIFVAWSYRNSGCARQKIAFVSARDRATGEMSVAATWSFRPSCEWMSRRSLPNKMSLEGAVARVIFISGYLRQTFVRRGSPRSLFLDDPAQIGAMQLIKLAADKALELNQVSCRAFLDAEEPGGTPSFQKDGPIPGRGGARPKVCSFTQRFVRRC
jgi:hypothetical protein